MKWIYLMDAQKKEKYKMNDFVYEYPVKTYFAKNAIEKYLSKVVEPYGKKVLLAYGGGSIKRNGIYDAVVKALKDADKEIVEFSGIMPNPTYAKVLEGTKLAKDNNVDLILAVGGGSVIDCSKIVAAAAKMDGDIWTEEMVNRHLPTQFVKMGVVLTLTGTGSEMDNGGVITNEDLKVKAGMLGAYSDFAIMDPSFTKGMPEKKFMPAAFDTLSHCMETYFGNIDSINLSDQINEAVMKAQIENIRKYVKNPEDENVLGELAWASSMGENGILKIGKVTDFQCHQIEHQLGAYTNCVHGEGLAVLHPALYRHIYKNGVKKFARWARNVWDVKEDDDEKAAVKGIDALADFIKEIGLPTTLTELGITDEGILKKVAETSNISPGCCKQLTADEILDILHEVK